jgi:hypothetical protein
LQLPMCWGLELELGLGSPCCWESSLLEARSRQSPYSPGSCR